MRSILPDFRSSKLKWNYFALAMRMGYLFTEALSSGGMVMDGYIFYYRKDTFPEHLKWEVILRKTWTPEQHQKLTSIRRDMYRHQAVKNKTAKGIVAYRQLQAGMHKFFLKVMEEMETYFFGQGFMRMDAEFVNKGGFGSYTVDYDEPETNDINIGVPFSEIFLGDVDPEVGHPWVMHLLPFDFLSHPLIKDAVTDAYNPSAPNADSIYLQHFISVPDPTPLSMNEMLLARRRMMNMNEPFRTALVEWNKQFYKGDSSSAATLDYFKQKVLPEAKVLQQAVDVNEILQMLVKQRPGAPHVNMLIGEVPVAVLWEYYKDMEVLPPQTWEVLQRKMETEERLKRRFPIIAIDTPWMEPTEDNELVTALFKPRKSIKVD